MAAAAKPAPAVGPSMRDFTILQALGKGSYGSVFKAVRKSDGFKCVVDSLSRGYAGVVLVDLPIRCPRSSYAIKEVNIRKLNPRERCAARHFADNLFYRCS